MAIYSLRVWPPPLLAEKCFKLKMIYMFWKGFSTICYEQLPDGLSRELWSLKVVIWDEKAPTPLKIESKKFVFRWLEGNWHCVEPMLFLVKNWSIRLPTPLSDKLHYFKRKQSQESLTAAIRFSANSNSILDLFLQPEFKILLKS